MKQSWIPYENSGQAGMALPMVLWTIALLAGITLLLAGIIDGWITDETHSDRVFRARQQALTGVAIAMNPAILPGDPLLEKRRSDNEEGYKVVIKDESGLINPNTWLAATPDRRDLFRRLFGVWGLDINQCETVADALYDWQSPTPFRSLHGAKQPEYEAAGLSGLPPGAPFTSPAEMALVLGFQPVMQAKRDWNSYFTTYYAGKINILHAPKTILTDLLGLSSAQADSWIILRNGKDGIEGSGDEPVVPSITNAVALIGANGTQEAAILDTCDVTGSVRRIESTGFSHGVTHLITVIVSVGITVNLQGTTGVLGWFEL